MRDFYDVMQACGMNVPPIEAWLAHYSQNSELWPIMREGKMIGGVLFKGHLVHIAVRPEWHGRWITRDMLRGYRSWIHDVPIVATPPRENAQACALAERLGMKRTGVTGPGGQFIIYEKEPNPCPQH